MYSLQHTFFFIYTYSIDELCFSGTFGGHRFSYTFFKFVCNYALRLILTQIFYFNYKSGIPQLIN